MAACAKKAEGDVVIGVRSETVQCIKGGIGVDCGVKLIDGCEFR